ncbi:hypothetical protein F0267_00495 [Vibrio coralliilyticus]|uniref:Uncharacterized protein n=1 Tax=Vibrio coralliilyticus TaxID=190893 RepID=A0AAN0SJW8_9VIBR|nr:hypothetical protein [Vibrio coralliilyticus]AIW22601.1 hypothetical protein IX92_26425 [Vibrio coralliilyticus]NOH36698.1 hypothetical protein [Vibrio coralliilyticus]
MSDNKSVSNDPFVEELNLMVERLSKRGDYKGSLQVSMGKVNGENTYMIIASENKDAQDKLHTILGERFNEVCIEDRAEQFRNMMPEGLKQLMSKS